MNRKELVVKIKDFDSFKSKLVLFGNQFNRFVLLDSNGYCKKNSKYSWCEYSFLAGLDSIKELKSEEKGSFKKLSEFNRETKDWLFGYLTYDLKNDIENLSSNNIDECNFIPLHFFIPKVVFLSKHDNLSVLYFEKDYSKKEIKDLIEKIESIELTVKNKKDAIKIESRYSKEEYEEAFKLLKKHIQIGDIYEVNFCQEFYQYEKIDPVDTYLNLKEISPTPFSCFYKLNTNYLLSASPERFLKKQNSKVISQPIKGTIKRSRNKEEDANLKEKLFQDPKERAENVMITDLVRNDLSKTAKKGTVKVEELYGIYSFKQVHQMISTVVSEVEDETDIVDIIKNAFPMGSMTGAPKIRAMKLIEKYEKTKRGLYSGAVGFISPNKDFDFNVVIRSILYNQHKNYVSFTVGGAITSMALANNEYDECMLKSEAMLKVLQP